MHDILIKDGLIVDGTGKAPFPGDVAVTGDRIVEVGKVAGPAKRTVQANGHLITPGFVDIHTHFDGQVSWDSMLAPSCYHGVTSVVMGNCGVGFAPAQTDKHAFLIELLEGVEDIPGTALAEGLTWDWESFSDYLNALGGREYTLDVGAQLPHASLRAFVMGERGADHTQHPSDGEIDEIAALTYEALNAGAMGFSTSRTYVHQTRAGKNIGTLKAQERELSAIAKAIGRAGKGVVQLISDAYLSTDPDFVRGELDLIRMLASESGRKLSFTVTQHDDVPGRWRELLNAAREMTASGLTVRTQVAPRPVGGIFGLEVSTNPFAATATYREIVDLPLAERVARLRTPEMKERILAEHRSAAYTGYAVMLKAFGIMFRMVDPVDYEPPASASLLKEAERAGREPDEYVYDVMLEEDGRRAIYVPVVNYNQGNLNDIYVMMADPISLFGLSDAGAHCGAICDGSFPTTTIGLWSKGTRDGLKIPLEYLIHGYTQRNAVHVGWLDRGVVAPGYLADLNVIDLESLDVRAPKVVADLPAGGRRILQGAKGYLWTIKRGQVTFENGTWTEALPGRLQRGAQPAIG